MSNKKGVISLSFNQDHNCIACCTETGLRVYNVEPMVLKEQFVAGGKYPKTSLKTVLFYDAVKKIFVLETNFSSPVKAVRMKRDKAIIATLDKVFIFNSPTPFYHVATFDTRPNPLGLLQVTPMHNAERQILVYPGNKIGSIHILDLKNLEENSSSAPAIINAHNGEITCLAINQEGTLIASASDKGTLIRIWDTIRKTKVAELRRGTDTATLYCMNFSPDSEFLCCSSDKGTVHIFALKDPDLNRRSSLSTLGFFSSYIESQWALATFTVPPEVACICAFENQNTVMAVCLDGTFHKYTFLKDGSCRRKAYHVFLHDCQDEEI
ncbi:WD repeat domain phosphoinositide-interacting protein 4-like isoform X2 [Sipha flava]|uniref:WD repeat domain phosphoinositide-interacting protein 4-like isoform X2 n=1 Tax=Sipha flava TaxID=143950 RepID=A0A8B8GNV7_9HEMI|nr:WD repeat domain phosphoinositide-interacting protein 4-like isoform X2 [Sipha flava]